MPRAGLLASPLVVPVNNLTFNGIDVGNVQYVNGFMRAEFWNPIKGSSAYSNPINYSLAPAITIVADAPNGIAGGSGCDQYGIVGHSYFYSQLANQMQTLAASGVISPTSFVLFLTNNVILSRTDPPVPWFANCCISGYHSWSGSNSTPQFYAVADYHTATVGTFKARNTIIAAHEIAEFMNDPYAP